MAVGDGVLTIETVADNASMTIRPTGTIEWILHNIYVPSTAAIEFYRSDGTLTILSDTNTGSLYNFFFHVSNTQYITVKNVSGGSIQLGYDGTVTRV